MSQSGIVIDAETGEVLPTPYLTVQDWADKINGERVRGVEAVLNVGRYLIAAREALKERRGEFGHLITHLVWFKSKGTAAKYMSIAGNSLLTEVSNWKLLPCHWVTLYFLSCLPDDYLVERFEASAISPNLKGSTVRGWLKELKAISAGNHIPLASLHPVLYCARAEDLPLENDTVDIIITSPPYNLGKENWPMGGDGRRERSAGIGYGDDLSEDEYQTWQVVCLNEMYRVAKEGASLFYNHKVRNRDGHGIHPIEWIIQSFWTFRQEIIWDRGSTHNHNPVYFWPHDERIYWLTKGPPRLPKRAIGQPTIWRFHGPVADTWHPAPFHEELPRRCLEATAQPGMTVLDPFMGSGTTCKVALSFGCYAIGVDICQDYIDMARKEHGWFS